MQDAYEEAQSRQIADAMARGDTRIGIAQLRATERPFLMEFTNMKQPTIEALRAFLIDAGSFQREHGRMKVARTLAGMMLADNPTHHSIAPKVGEDKIPSQQGYQALQDLAVRLTNTATKQEVLWFAKSVAEQARAK
jgi:hypothetical protein